MTSPTTKYPILSSGCHHCASTSQSMLAMLLLLTAALLVTVGGCQNPPARIHAPESSVAPEARKQWDLARTAWLLDDVAAAQSAFSRFAESNPQDPRSGEALLTAGICAQRRGRKEEADGLLREAQSRGGAVAARALLQRGYLLLSEQPERAVSCFAKAAEKALDPETRAEGWLQHGQALQKSGRFKQAVLPLNHCADQQAAPGLAARARLLLQLDPWFTVQVGAFLDRSNAQRQLRRLESAGLPAEHRMPGRRGSPLHHVLSGRFDRRDAAVRHSTRIKQILGTEDVKVIP